MGRRFGVFLDSLFRKYTERKELEEHFASLQLNTYRISKAKKVMLLQLLWLDQETEKRIDRTEHSNHSILKFQYYSKFVDNLFSCLADMVYAHQGLLKRIPTPKTLFHGTTTAFLPNIAKEALHPSKAGQCWIEDKYKKLRKVCLTDSLYAAEYFALVAAEEVGGGAVVLKVDVKGLEDKMHIMTETLSNDGSTVFGKYFEFYFTESIPPNRIKKLYVLPKPSAYELLTYLIDYGNLSENSKEEEQCRLETNLVVKT